MIYSMTISRKSSPETNKKTSLNIIELVKENPRIKISEMSLELGITERAVKKALAALKERKLIAREGPNKGGVWKLLH